MAAEIMIKIIFLTFVLYKSTIWKGTCLYNIAMSST